MRDDDFLKMLEKLQQKIEYEEEQTYSKIVINEYRNPSNFGVLDNPDAVATIKGPCGDTMKISLKIDKLKITDARFWTDGCGATIACGNMLTKMIIGNSIVKTSKITDSDLIEALDGLPKEHKHCALLSVNTLHKAIELYFNRQ